MLKISTFAKILKSENSRGLICWMFFAKSESNQ